MTNINTLSIRGRQASFIDQGSGVPLVLVHGFPLDHSMWQNQIGFFKNNYRTIVVDLPGFGNSESIVAGNTGTLTMEALADWLAEFLLTIDCCVPVNFCGLSMGGYIGWEFVRRYPERLQSMIACHTRADADSEVTRRGRGIIARQVLAQGADSIATGMIKKLFYQRTTDAKSDAFYDQTRQVIASTSRQSVAAGQRGMAIRANARPWLDQITAPTLFLAGQHDTITPASEMSADADQVSGSEYVVIPHAGHLSPLENPQAFNRVVNDFLQRQARLPTC